MNTNSGNDFQHFKSENDFCTAVEPHSLTEQVLALCVCVCSDWGYWVKNTVEDMCEAGKCVSSFLVFTPFRQEDQSKLYKLRLTA